MLPVFFYDKVVSKILYIKNPLLQQKQTNQIIYYKYPTFNINNNISNTSVTTINPLFLLHLKKNNS